MSLEGERYDEIASIDLVELAYHEEDNDRYWSVIGELRRRGNQTEFDLAMSLVRSDDALKRQIGVSILAQLGWGQDSFHDESVDVLISLLGDECADVVGASAFGLGHRNNSRAIPYLLKLVEHPDDGVRHAVAFGLSGYDDEVAVSGLIFLSDDQSDDVRNWAIFGLGQQCEMDSSAIRDVFFKHLQEENPEIRGEAMIGLAIRQDDRVKSAIIQELEGEFHGTWSAQAYPQPDFVSFLQKVREKEYKEVPDHMISCIDEAIAACSAKPVGM
ncbi:MAG: HEAT repeat domain-containing protein [Alphaproteobacteria bacterium]